MIFFKQKTAYEMRISDWSSDVCSSDLRRDHRLACRLDHIEQRVEIGAARGLAEFADVGAGDEGAAVAAQHDRLDAIVGERGLEMLLEAPADVPRQRVDGRIVDDDDGDVAGLLHRDADRKSTSLNSSHYCAPRSPSSA